MLTHLFRKKTAFFSFAAFFCLIALAQSPAVFSAPEDDIDVAARRTQSARDVAKTAQQAEAEKLLEGSQKVTFEDVLRDPDNIDLNYLYAQRQIAENDVLGASATLERILMINPNLPRVRLLYAVVLYRLDDLVEAEREIKILESQPMPDSLRQELKIYQKQIKMRQKRTVLGVQQANGFGYDWNRNAVSSAKQVLFADTTLDVSDESRREADTHFLNITSLDFSHDLGFQAGHQVFGSFTYYRQEQTHADSLDLSSLQFELGGVYKNKFVNITPSFSASQLFLSQEHYLRSQSWKIQADRNITKKLNVFTNYQVERQDYLPIFENAAANTRDGNENSASLGGSYTITPSMKFGTSLYYANKTARAHYEAYNRLMIKTYHSWLLGKGQFLLNSFDTGFDYYHQPDFATAGLYRKDKSIRYRVTYGAPLTFFLIGKILPRQLSDITASFSFEYYRAYSTLINYTYTNYQYQGLLSKRWEF